nr:rhamnogalacturonan acetylesterase [Curvibacter sp. CHRR-16]
MGATGAVGAEPIRIFIAGDSTASHYSEQVYPRMGWGQVLERQLQPGAAVQVVNLAQPGRSSRSFISEGWFARIQGQIRAGDYLLIQFGHNDEKCGEDPPRPPPARDQADFAKLCTYPGVDAQHADGVSFAATLARYIDMARTVGATPVLITPVTRRAFRNGRLEAQTHHKTKGKFPGDYSQTVRDTAQRHQVPLIDLDVRSVAFFNQVGEVASLDYFLAVDPERYPYYRTEQGSRSNPDNTHFQERGAVAMSELVVQGLRDLKLPLAEQFVQGTTAQP